MKDYGGLYEILAIGYYNGERRKLYYSLLKKCLLSPKFKINLKKEIENFEKDLLPKTDFRSDYFREFDRIITSGLDSQIILEYIIERYHQFDKEFNKEYGLPLSAFTLIATKLLKYVHNRISSPNLLPVYQFKNKEEYGNKNFIAFPNKDYIQNYRLTYTVNGDEFKSKLNPKLQNFWELFLKIYSFDISMFKTNPELRFKEYPLFRIDSNIIFVDPSVYFTYLPHKIHILLNRCIEFRDKKGKLFEDMAINLLRNVPNSKLEGKNILYGEKSYELDGLLNLRRSTWFIECKSRNLSPDSLKGDRKKIDKDIKRAIEESLQQGTRAIEYKLEFRKYHLRKIKGILILLEGIFPNIRYPLIAGPNPLDQSAFPVCVMNYFELYQILRQPDSHRFEEFLIWRSQKNMPIFAFDELDYWAYFNNIYKRNREIRDRFSDLKKREITIIYISQRFNKKDYLK